MSTPEEPPSSASTESMDLVSAAATIASIVDSATNATAPPVEALADFLDALALLHWMHGQLAVIEPVLIAAARDAGASWQALAPALGVASRQAAERRYLRLAPATQPGAGDTRDDRVRAERDRRAGHRAVARWANDNTADLRRLAGQISALADADDDAESPIRRLHNALADPDASGLPVLLADTQRYLQDHPKLSAQVDAVTAHTDLVRRQTQQQRDGVAPSQ